MGLQELPTQAVAVAETWDTIIRPATGTNQPELPPAVVPVL